jgi:cell division transport system permease protein
MISFFRIVKFAGQDMIRNMSLSIMTVFILILMLLTVNTIVAIRALTSEATELIKGQIDVSIFISHAATDSEIEEIRSVVENFPEVVGLTYKTSEEVLEDFRSNYQDNPDIITSLEELESNPLGPTMIVQTREPGDYETIIAALQVPEYENIIEARTFDDTQVTIERIELITTQVEVFSIALSVFFGVVAFFIIFNTIRVSIYTQRTEISIKKLVGATSSFVRGPYIVQAIFFTILSTILSILILSTAIKFFDPYVAVVFEQNQVLTNYFTSNILVLTSVQFVAVLLLTTVSSILAMRRYLRV